MKSRFLPILNLVGCLALTGLVVTQWNKERGLGDDLAKLRTRLAAATDLAAAEAKRAAALERDIEVLKESIESTQKAAEEAARNSAELETTREAEAAAAREQVKTWQAAIDERDAKLRELNADLTATRQRLDAAIAKLKEAGAR